jgi:trans-2,3-dihydro-3-hydroxyanthranilate isomerase
MTEHPFRIVNVFTQAGGPPVPGGLSGNPLCVFEDGANLDTAVMQALARQFNLSETTFILPSARADARMRIFTPNYEMAFAGHPTLGTAQVCRSLGLGGDRLTLECEAGLIPVEARDARWTLTALAATSRDLEASRGELAAALGLEEQDIHGRPLWVKSGKEQLIVPLTSVAAVRRAAPVAAKLQQIRSEDGQCMAYVFAFQGATQATARFFFSQGSAILEDPATGSATSNFGAWCLLQDMPLPLQVQISQGGDVGRPSTLFLDVDVDRAVHVGGDIIEIARGSVSI